MWHQLKVIHHPSFPYVSHTHQIIVLTVVSKDISLAPEEVDLPSKHANRIRINLHNILHYRVNYYTNKVVIVYAMLKWSYSSNEKPPS
jgi:hypothetical protein